MKENLRRVYQVLEKWETCTVTLTSHYWPGYDAHKWTGGKFVEDLLAPLTKRVGDVSITNNQSFYLLLNL